MHTDLWVNLRVATDAAFALCRQVMIDEAVQGAYQEQTDLLLLVRSDDQLPVPVGGREGGDASSTSGTRRRRRSLKRRVAVARRRHRSRSMASTPRSKVRTPSRSRMDRAWPCACSGRSWDQPGLHPRSPAITGSRGRRAQGRARLREGEGRIDLLRGARASTTMDLFQRSMILIRRWPATPASRAAGWHRRGETCR
jgi:hypothetical protein